MLLISQDVLQKDKGFYIFGNRNEIIEKRLDAYLLVKQKMNIAKRAARLIRFVPFVSALFVCNTVAGAVPSRPRA